MYCCKAAGGIRFFTGGYRSSLTPDTGDCVAYLYRWVLREVRIWLRTDVVSYQVASYPLGGGVRNACLAHETVRPDLAGLAGGCRLVPCV